MYEAAAERFTVGGMQIEELVDNFSFLDDWEDRYRYLIELGRGLPPLEDSERNPQTKVRGCASQVWLISHAQGQGRTQSSPSEATATRISCVALSPFCSPLFRTRRPATSSASTKGPFSRSWG